MPVNKSSTKGCESGGDRHSLKFWFKLLSQLRWRASSQYDWKPFVLGATCTLVTHREAKILLGQLPKFLFYVARQLTSDAKGRAYSIRGATACPTHWSANDRMIKASCKLSPFVFVML